MACDAFIECRSFPSQIHIWGDDYKIATAVNALMSLLPGTELIGLCFESIIAFWVPVPLAFVKQSLSNQLGLPFKNPLLWASLVYLMKGCAPSLSAPPKILKNIYINSQQRPGHFESVPRKQDDRCDFYYYFFFPILGLLDGDVHHVQGSHWEERVSLRLDGHEHGSEQVSCPSLLAAPVPAVTRKDTGGDKAGHCLPGEKKSKCPSSSRPTFNPWETPHQPWTLCVS